MAESAVMNGNGTHVNGKTNGQTVGRRRFNKKRRSPLLWTFNVAARSVDPSSLISSQVLAAVGARPVGADPGIIIN